MKCVFAIKSLTNPGGGAERVFVDVVNGLVAREHDVIALTYDRPAAKAFYPLESRIEWVRLGMGRTDQSTTPLETAKRIVSLRRAVADLKPDVAIGFMHSMFIPLGLAMMGAGVPLIASEHIVSAHYASRPLERALLRLTPWLARCIVVVSEQARAGYPAALRARMMVIPNPVDVMVTMRADVFGVNRSRKILLTVGRLAEQKDHTTLIDAFALIAARLPDWDLRIIGEGECRDALQARIAAAGLNGRISLPGATADIGTEFAGAQLFVMPSLYESQGLAVAEALAHGLPAVGFADCPGVNSLIRPDRNGALASGPDRVDSLAKALERLMADDQARADLAPPPSTAFEENSPKRVLDRWETMLNDALRTRSLRSSA